MTSTTNRRSGAERREQIARAALKLIGTQGLGGVTTSALASEVGLSSGALFRHFDSREAMLDEAVGMAVAWVDATLPSTSLPALERLRTLALARVRLLSKTPAIAWLLRSGQAASSLPPGSVKQLRALVRRSRAFIRDALAEAVEAGSVRRDVAPEVLLLLFTATVHALITQPGVHGRPARGLGPEAAVDGLLTLLATHEPTDEGR